jgi:hypothetical protein
MGEVVPKEIAQALGEAIVQVLQHGEAYAQPREAIERIFSLQRTEEQYERLFGEIAGAVGRGDSGD